MNKALKLCLLATSPNSPNPTAGLVKVDDGMMSAYNGLFCIRTPISHNIGAVFNPRALATFFRKERKKVAYTIKFPKLTVSEGKERLTISCLPCEEMVIVDNIETATPCELNLDMLKTAAELCVTDGKPYAAGVTFRDGMMMSTSNAVFFCGHSGLPDDLRFVIHKDAAVALTKFKGKVVSYAKNKQSIKFNFSEGSSLCAHILVDEIPDIDPLFDGDWMDFRITEDILKLDCDHIEVRAGSLNFYTKDTVGELDGVIDGDVTFKVFKKQFDRLLELKGDLSCCGTKLQCVGDGCVMVCSLMV